MEKEIGPKLGRQDWLTIGLKTLVESGIEAVRVEPLAKLLKVTRGSFYWHFKNRDDLLEAILQAWEIQNTESIIQEVETEGTDPGSKLLNLFEIAARDDDHLEKAVRIWGVHDARALAAIGRVDQRRLDYLQNLFLELGFSPKEAKVRARIVYSVRLGWFMMESPSELSERLTEIRFMYKILTQFHTSSK
jgi:AcrR family transcriptional regulator